MHNTETGAYTQRVHNRLISSWETNRW